MKSAATETVGDKFSTDLLREARDRSVDVIDQVAALVRPSMSMADQKTLLQTTQEKLGMPKSWHPPQIRLGINTLLPFGHKGPEDLVLQQRDIYFLDIGAIFDGHEGDPTRAFGAFYEDLLN